MSSVAALYSQVPVRAKFLKAVPTPVTFDLSGSLPDTYMVRGVHAYGPQEFSLTGALTAVMTEAAFGDATSAGTATNTTNTTSLYRELGKRVAVVDADGVQQALYALVRNAAAAEDPEASDLLVKVWDLMNPETVRVAVV